MIGYLLIPGTSTRLQPGQTLQPEFVKRYCHFTATFTTTLFAAASARMMQTSS